MTAAVAAAAPADGTGRAGVELRPSIALDETVGRANQIKEAAGDRFADIEPNRTGTEAVSTETAPAAPAAPAPVVSGTFEQISAYIVNTRTRWSMFTTGAVASPGGACGPVVPLSRAGGS